MADSISFHNTLHRWNSRVMFAVCIVFTAAILAAALVIGYLISIARRT